SFSRDWSSDVCSTDLPTIANTQYFTTPTALPGNTPASGAVGELRVDGSAVAVVTAIDFNINGNGSTEGVIGSAVSPDVFRGIIQIARAPCRGSYHVLV